MAIKLSGIHALNIGNGTAINLNWSIADISLVKYFVVERFDRYSRKYKPFDDFHGIVAGEAGSAIPQSTVVSIQDSLPTQQFFRVKAVFKDNSESEWIETSTTLEAIGTSIGTPEIYYIPLENEDDVSLKVSHMGEYSFLVNPGVAVLKGVRIPVPNQCSITVPRTNNINYVVYIDAKGVVSFIQGTTTPDESIRLANISINNFGAITVTDTRRLWAPDWDNPDLIVAAQSIIPRNIINIIPYEECNLSKYRIYRGSGDTLPESLDFLIDIPSTMPVYEDIQAISAGVRYWYAVSAVDYGENCSPKSDARDIMSQSFGGGTGDSTPPAVPTGLEIEIIKVGNQFVPTASWNENIEVDLDHYNIWVGYSVVTEANPNGEAMGMARHQVSTETTDVAITNITQGDHFIAVSAVDTSGNESAYCTPIQVKLYDQTIPVAPTWCSPAYSTTGAQGSTGCSVTLNLHAVTRNVGDEITPATDICEYRIYIVEGAKHSLVGSVYQTSTIDISKTFTGMIGGDTLVYCITALDSYGHESEYSTTQSIMVGEATIPSAPTNGRYTLLYPPTVQADCVKILWNAVTTNTNASACTDLANYKIYRGSTSASSVLVGTVASNVLEWTDLNVVRLLQYSYFVSAIDTSGNESSKTSAITVTIGNTTACNAPAWDATPLTTSYSFITDKATNVLHFSGSNEETLSHYVIEATYDGVFIPIGRVNKTVSTSYTFSHSNILYGISFSYRMCSEDYSGNRSSYTSTQTIVAGTGTTLGQPVVTAVSAYNIGALRADIEVSWLAIDNATQYLIERSENGTYYSYLVQTSDLSVLDTGLINGKTYWYRVKALHDTIDSGFGTADSAVAGYSSVPSTPSVSTAISLGPSIDSSHSITLSWDACTDSSGIHHYNIYRRHPVTSTEWIKIAETTAVTYVDNDRVYNVAYYYKVSAVNMFMLGGLMGSANTTCVDSTVPTHIDAATSSLQAMGQHYKVTLTWTYSPPTDFASYKVWRKITSSGSAFLISTISDSTTKTFSESGLNAGTEYIYYITCTDTYGNTSSMTDSVSVTPSDATIPATPGTITATGIYSGVQVSFSAVTTNNDASTMTDFDMYYLAAGNSDSFVANDSTTILESRLPTFIHATGYDALTWYYKVRVKDIYGNYSAWSTVSNGASATRFATAPVAPTGVAATAEIDNLTDGTRNYHLHVTWSHTPDANFSVYNIYNGSTLIEQRRESPCIINNLYPGNYTISVSAQDKFGNESTRTATNPATTTIANTPVTITGPATSKLIVGVRIFGISWEDVKTRGTSPIINLDYYELQYASSTDAGHTYIEDDWLPLFSGKVTYFVHGGNDARLDYNKYHVYRVRVADTFGNISTWVRITGDNKKPSQNGQDDLALNSIMAEHIYSNSIETRHISSEGIDATNGCIKHLKSASIDAGEINAAHLTVSLGTYNHIKNSAFGMKNLSKVLGVDWTLVNSTIEEQSDIPLFGVNTCARLVKAASGDATRTVTQEVDVTKLKGTTCIFSMYQKGVSIDGTLPTTKITVVSPTLGTSTYTRDVALGSTAWQRYSVTLAIPSDASSITVQSIMTDTCTGTLYVTGLQLEVADIISAWHPNSNELYGSTGNVQINSTGILVTGGNIKVQDTDANGTTTLTSLGMTVSKASGGAASLTSAGLVVSDGAIDISSNTAGGQFYINANGIYAYKKVGQSTYPRIAILSSDGSVSITDGTITMNGTGNNVLTLTNTGLTASYGGNDVFKLDSTTGLVSIVGSMNISTGVGANNYIKLDGPNNLLEMKNSSGEQVFKVDGGTGEVVLAGSGVTLRTTTTDSGSRVTFNSTGLKGYSGSTLGWHLKNDGSAVFNNSVVIKSPTSGASQIVIDVTSDAGNQAGLSGNGWYLQERGASFTNVSIANGSISMSSTGMSIKDPDGSTFTGITIKDINNNSMTTIDSRGIRLLADGSIKLAGGSITFSDGSTAIYSDRIEAAKVKGTQIIVKDSTDGVGSISIQDSSGVEKVLLDNDGITITDGALNVTAPGGGVLISNGVVNAQALNIGAGGDNWLLNGRADFPFTDGDFDTTSKWTKIGTPTITRDTGMTTTGGWSGEYSFKVIASTIGHGMKQGAAWAYTSTTQSLNTVVYTLSCWVKALSGRWKVSVIDGVTDLNATPVESSDIVAADGSKLIVLRFKALQSPMTYVAVTCIGDISDTATCYITDVMVSKGNTNSGYSAHSSEIFSQNIRISKDELVINNGKLNITTAAGTVTLGASGLVCDTNSGAFSLTESGFSLEYGVGNTVTINKDVGVYSESGSNSVQIKNGSIIIRGSGGIDIQNTGVGGKKLTIDSTKIQADTSSDNYVRLDTDGLSILGSGIVSIKSSTLESAARMYISDSSLKIFAPNNNDSTPSINIGLVSTVPTISIVDGSFSIKSTTGGVDKVRIDNEGILISNGAAFSLLSGSTEGNSGVVIKNTGITITNGTFNLSSLTSSSGISMDNDKILLRHAPDSTRIGMRTQITANGLTTIDDDGNIINPYLAGLQWLQDVQFTNGMYTWTLPKKYSMNCSIIPIITQLPTYNKNESPRSQGYRLSVSKTAYPSPYQYYVKDVTVTASLYSNEASAQSELLAAGYTIFDPIRDEASQNMCSENSTSYTTYSFKTWAETVREATLYFHLKTHNGSLLKIGLWVHIDVKEIYPGSSNTWTTWMHQYFSQSDMYNNGYYWAPTYTINSTIPHIPTTEQYNNGVQLEFRMYAYSSNNYNLNSGEGRVYCRFTGVHYHTGGVVALPDYVRCGAIIVDSVIPG